jgi:hypothetical protein
MTQREYTILLQKGLGMIEETIILLRLWEPRMNNPQVVDLALERGSLGRSTEYRVKDIITRVFFKRYVCKDNIPAKYLKQLVTLNYPLTELKQLLMLYTCRSDDALYDFVQEIYWPKYYAGVEFIWKDDSLTFLNEAALKGYMKNNWAETQTRRIASNLLGCLTDFKLFGKNQAGKRALIPTHISKKTVIFVAHDLHFSGYSDNSILENPDWGLFGLKRIDILRELENASYDGHFIIQYSGEILKISWKYASMEECICAISE